MSKNLRDSDRKGFVNGFTNQRLKRPQLANVWQAGILTGPRGAPVKRLLMRTLAYRLPQRVALCTDACHLRPDGGTLKGAPGIQNSPWQTTPHLLHGRVDLIGRQRRAPACTMSPSEPRCGSAQDRNERAKIASLPFTLPVRSTQQAESIPTPSTEVGPCCERLRVMRRGDSLRLQIGS